MTNKKPWAQKFKSINYGAIDNWGVATLIQEINEKTNENKEGVSDSFPCIDDSEAHNDEIIFLGRKEDHDIDFLMDFLKENDISFEKNKADNESLESVTVDGFDSLRKLAAAGFEFRGSKPILTQEMLIAASSGRQKSIS